MPTDLDGAALAETSVDAAPLASEPPHDDLGLVGQSLAMERLRASIRLVAPTGVNVLILGESGSGKELVARAIHSLSVASGPFVATNAASLDHGLVESELFGHAKGAFTGALSTRRGLFEEADGGTLFLDEVAELPLATQSRLLRVLETGEVRALGAEKSRSVRARLLCATYRDVSRAVMEGAFRADLYHRVATFVVRVPPLRERFEDLPLLAAHLLVRHASMLGRRALTDAALAALATHSWGGNVRELGNVVLRAAILSQRELVGAAYVERALAIDTRMVSVPVRAPRREPVSDETIRETLTRCEGRVAAAARALGIPRRTLRDRVRTLASPS